MADADETAPKMAVKRSIDENAVGYQEYVEGLDLEVSDREVRVLASSLLLTCVPIANVNHSSEGSAGR